MTNEQLCALAKRGDADAQNLLIENNLRFIKKTACGHGFYQGDKSVPLRHLLEFILRLRRFRSVLPQQY